MSNGFCTRKEDFTEEEIVCILEIARAQGLDATLIERVIAIDEREEVVLCIELLGRRSRWA